MLRVVIGITQVSTHNLYFHREIRKKYFFKITYLSRAMINFSVCRVKDNTDILMLYH